MAELNKKQIYEMRMKLKAPKRGTYMRRRTEYLRHKYEIQVQNEIARHIVSRI